MALQDRSPRSAARDRIRRMALVCTALMLATIVLSAYMRLSQSGLGCADWPACYGQAQREAASGRLATVPVEHGVALARMAHRIVASAVLVLVAAMVVIARAARPALAHESRAAMGLLGLALALAVLGIVTPGALLPAVTIGNLVGGFVMLALCWRLAAVAAAPAPPTIELRRWARLGLALVLAQVALGALVSGSFAALSCSDWSDCSRTALEAGRGWQALNPWQRPTLEAAPPFNAAGAWAQLAHRLGALLLVPVLVLVGVLAWRRGLRITAVALWALLGLQVLVGSSVVAAGLPIVLVLVHNLNAACLLALLARLA